MQKKIDMDFFQNTITQEVSANEIQSIPALRENKNIRLNVSLSKKLNRLSKKVLELQSAFQGKALHATSETPLEKNTSLNKTFEQLLEKNEAFDDLMTEKSEKLEKEDELLPEEANQANGFFYMYKTMTTDDLEYMLKPQGGLKACDQIEGVILKDLFFKKRNLMASQKHPEPPQRAPLMQQAAPWNAAQAQPVAEPALSHQVEQGGTGSIESP